MEAELYSDNGAELGLRTRLFRNAADGGVEWMYAVDHAAVDRDWETDTTPKTIND